jgi:hypothetical protein
MVGGWSVYNVVGVIHAPAVAQSGNLKQPSAISDPSTGRNIFYIGADSAIWQWSIQNGSWSNVKLTGTGTYSLARAGTSPSAIYDPNTGRNIFYVGADGAIWQWSVQNGQWNNFRIGGEALPGSTISAVYDSATGRNVFYVGLDGSINQWSIQNGGWVNVKMGGVAQSGSSPTAVSDTVNGTGRNVFYVGLDNKISQWSAQNGNWSNVELAGTGTNQTVAGGSSPNAMVDNVDNTGRNIFFIGSDSYVYQWSVQNGQWNQFKLQGTGGAQTAASGSSPNAVSDAGTARNVFYVGSNNQIYQWSVQGGQWNNTMLTGTGGNTPADSGSSPGTMSDAPTGRNIFYYNNNQIWQWSVQNSQWNNFFL